MASKQISDLLPASSLNATDLMVAQQIEGCAKFSLDALANYILSQSDRGFISASIATNTTVSSPMHGKDYLYYAAPSASDITLTLPYTGPNIPATGTRVWVLNASTTHRVTVSFGASDSETILPGFSLALFWAGSEWTPLWTDVKTAYWTVASTGSITMLPAQFNIIEYSASAGGTTYTLPRAGLGTAPRVGTVCYISNTGTGFIGVEYAPSTYLPLSAGLSALIVWNGAEWLVVTSDAKWAPEIASLKTRATNLETRATNLETRVTNLETATPLFAPPGRFVVAMPGRRRAASSTNPWHPIAVSRVFAQADAPDFFDALYDEFMDSDGAGIFSAEELGRLSNYVSGVQRISPPGSTLMDAIVRGIYTTGAARSYDYTQKDYPHGAGGATSTTAPRLAVFTANVSTNVLTLNPTYTTSVVMWTGLPVTVVKAPQLTNAIVGGIVYLRVASSTTATLHPTEQDAIDGTNTIDLTGTTDIIDVDLWTPHSKIVFGANTAGSNVPIGNYTITGIDISGNLLIQTASNATGTGATFSAAVYPYRVAGSTTSVIWHAIEDAAIMTPLEDGSIANGTMQLDQMQGHWHSAGSNTSGTPAAVANAGYAENSNDRGKPAAPAQNPITDGTNGTPRTGPRTRPRNVRWDSYVYVGANTL